MTEHTAEPTHDAADDPPLSPSEILMGIVVTILSPMFLIAGDVRMARLAATETVNAYRIRNQTDLIAIAQIIAFGLTALGSLGLSMADDLSLTMILRLRGNANALNRSAEQNRRALRESGYDPAVTNAEPPATSQEMEEQAALAAGVLAAQTLAAAAQARLRQTSPAVERNPAAVPSTTDRPRPAQPQPSVPAPAAQRPPTMPAKGIAPWNTASPQLASSLTGEDDYRRTTWAAAMSDVAAECSANLAKLPRAERRAESIRIAALTSTANFLLSGENEQSLRPHIRGGIPRPPRA